MAFSYGGFIPSFDRREVYAGPVEERQIDFYATKRIFEGA
jgi:hypothetical protein